MSNGNYIEYKFVNQLGSRLTLFKRKSENLFNFRCPVCGDSRKNKYKCRGYLYHRGDSYSFFCQNCNASMSFSQFLEYVDSGLYDDYRQELYLEKYAGGKQRKSIKSIFENSEIKNVETYNDSILKSLIKISDLSNNHFAKKYIISRQIPIDFHDKIYYSERFYGFINSIIEDKFPPDKFKAEHSRIVIPIRNRENKIVAISGRDILGQNKQRYYNINFDNSGAIFCGYERVDLNQTVYACEGAFDSFFIPNCVAALSANFNKTDRFFQKDRLVIILDNEPRNKDILGVYRKIIARDFKLVIWPDDFKPKDINQAILDGYTATSVKQIIDNNIYSELDAELRFNSWKKF